MTKTQLPLTLELAQPKLIAGEVDIQLSSNTRSQAKSNTFSLLGIVQDVTVDAVVDDVIA